AARPGRHRISQRRTYPFAAAAVLARSTEPTVLRHFRDHAGQRPDRPYRRFAFALGDCGASPANADRIVGNESSVRRPTAISRRTELYRRCPLPGGSGDVGGCDIGGVPVQAAASPLLARGGAGIEGRAPQPAGAPRRPDHQPSKGAGAGLCTSGTGAWPWPRPGSYSRAGRTSLLPVRAGSGRTDRRPGQPIPLPAMDPGWDEHRGAAPARPALGARATRAVLVPVVSVLFPAPGRGLD